jgi:hypothetical protein
LAILACTIFLAVSLVLCGASHAADAQTENVILVTLDGLRWQEVFQGADERLLNRESGGVRDVAAMRQRFWAETSVERRTRLMPFFWETIAVRGQVFGDPEQRSAARVTNGRYFSYPGYNELLSGHADPRIDSNDKRPNDNVTVLEWLHRQPQYHGRIAAFTSWDVFPYILNAQRSGMYVNAGWQDLEVADDAVRVGQLNRLGRELPHYWDGVRYDVFTMEGALAYLRQRLPRVLYIALGETDDWAHEGRYDLYLDAAWRSDRYLRSLWETVNQLEQYRDRTSLVVTTDHGRGDGREAWKSHGTAQPGSDSIWIAVRGPDTPPLGVRRDTTSTQSQVAATVAALLGNDFGASDPRIARPLPGVVAR